jgi:hypothetical protein
VKRMHYMAGAVGLAPAALGLAIAPATAGAATPGQAGHAKTVSLHHVLSTTVRTNMAAASSSSSTAASPDTTGGCTGNTYFRIPQSHDLKGHGWYANESLLDQHTCIGTVDIWVHFNKTFCKNVSLTAGVDEQWWSKTHYVCGTAGHSTMTQFNVHQNFSHIGIIQGVGVCVSSTYNRHGACKTVGS